MFFSNLASSGLYTYANPLGQQAIPGSMSVANNINCDEIGITTTRRGFDYYSSQQFSTVNGYITKLFVYNNILYASFNGGQFAQDNGYGVWTIYGSGFIMNPPAGGFLHQSLAGGNSYFTTLNGVYKLSGTNSNPPILAGAPVALDMQAVVTSGISTGFLSPGEQCGYAIVWGYTDDSNLLILGAPSQTVLAQNSNASGGSPVNQNLAFTIPPFCIQNQSVNWFYQIYRTPATTGSGSPNWVFTPPGNNFQLVDQASPASSDYTNRYISYPDITLDTFLGASLYTDTGQPDVGNPYLQPPLALDIAYFNSMAFFANYSTLQDALFSLDSVGAPNGIQIGDTISFTQGATVYTYTASSSNNPTTRNFAISSGGTAAQNIQQTAINLQFIINRDPNNTLFTVQYVSTPSGLPGQMQIYAQNLSQASFSIISSRSTCWSPAIPTSGTTYASANVSLPNGIFISNIGTPESVPAVNELQVGSPNFPITRIGVVRTALLVIKEEEGVFEITGSSPSTLNVAQLDTTAFIRGSETAVTLNNALYFNTTQGIMSGNESGLEIMSRNIQGDLLTLFSSLYTKFNSLAFAIGYQSDNAYIFFLAKSVSDTYSTIQYRYNWITQAWTTWDKDITAAVINTADDKLYLATPSGYILKERKDFAASDFADENIAITINSITSSTFTLANASNVSVGDLITQTVGGTTYQANVLAVNVVTNVVTVNSTANFTTGAANDLTSINSTITFMPITGGYPAFIKKFNIFNIAFASILFNSINISFSTDFYSASENVTLTPKSSNSWGTFNWGTVPWGNNAPTIQTISTYATKNTAIGHWNTLTLNLQNANSGFSLLGFSCFFDFFGSRSR